jgi:hypothetical protein
MRCISDTATIRGDHFTLVVYIKRSIQQGLTLAAAVQPPVCHDISRAAGDVLFTPEQVGHLTVLQYHSTAL